MRRVWTLLLIATLSLSGMAVAADALITTDEDELDSFVDDVTQPSLNGRLDAAIRHVDPDEAELRLTVDGQATRFEAGEAGELADAVRHALSVFDSRSQNLLQHAVRVDGEHATVTTRIGDEEYEQTVVYQLTRRADRWLVRGIRVL